MRYVSLILWLLVATPALLADETPRLDIDPNRVTVSGMSAGAQMAHQLHLAYSDVFSGAALLAGGPFGCAEGSVLNALQRCLAKPGTEIPMAQLQANIQLAAADGRLADLQNLEDDPVWIFHGSLDQAVPEAVNDALVQVYQELVPSTHLQVITDIPAAHTFPATDNGGPCDKVESPFVGNCDYDAAGKLLQHLYPGLDVPAAGAEAELVEVELGGASEALLDKTAWLYIPTACTKEGAGCALHMVLHGCGQSASQVQTAFIEQSGYLRWAGTNNIVLAFPQVVAGVTNPLACWDWWGYSDPNYLWREGKQQKLLANWARQLAGLEPLP